MDIPNWIYVWGILAIPLIGYLDWLFLHRLLEASINEYVATGRTSKTHYIVMTFIEMLLFFGGVGVGIFMMN